MSNDDAPAPMTEETDVDDEQRTRHIASLRAKGMCEKCAQPGHLDAAHRVSRAQGGQWSPANILMLCRPCHQHNHQNPAEAYAGGWHLPRNADPTEEPVLLFKQAQLQWAVLDNRGHMTPTKRGGQW